MQINFSDLWLAILGVAIGTFIIRFSFIYTFGKGQVPTWLQRVLQMVPASALSALVVPALLFSQQSSSIAGNHRLWAGLVAAFVAGKTRNILLTITIGMITLWLCDLLMP